MAVAVLVPIGGGGLGMATGLGLIHDQGPISDLDSHYRYLSGLLLGIGLAFAISIPRVERHGARIRLLAAIVVLGGLARLFAVSTADRLSLFTLGALIMELAVTPALALWQYRIAQGRR
jgi:hypothetical protein